MGRRKCDEKYLSAVLEQTRADVVVSMNLSRDQMDRAAEVRLLAEGWRRALEGSGAHVVANCDDPLVAWAASSAASVTWTACGQFWREDSWSCPRCGGPIDRPGQDEHVGVDIGDLRESDRRVVSPDAAGWTCRECMFARPEPAWRLDGDRVIAPDGGAYELSLRLPGRANRSNAAIALAACAHLGLAPGRALARFAEVTSVAGRYLTVQDGGRSMRLLLAKNPAGWLEAFDVLQQANAETGGRSGRSPRGPSPTSPRTSQHAAPAAAIQSLTGFENHQSRTHRGPGVPSLARTLTGIGNGDGTDGAYRGHIVGTYLHGPVLVRNPALADLLLTWAIGHALTPLASWADRLHEERLRAAPRPSRPPPS